MVWSTALSTWACLENLEQSIRVEMNILLVIIIKINSYITYYEIALCLSINS